MKNDRKGQNSKEKLLGDKKTVKSKENMLLALDRTLGIVSHACEKTGVSRSSHYKWQKSDPVYKERVEDIEDKAIDVAETSLMAQIRAQNTSATIFYLKTKGKKRGYIETMGHEHMGAIEWNETKTYSSGSHEHTKEEILKRVAEATGQSSDED